MKTCIKNVYEEGDFLKSDIWGICGFFCLFEDNKGNIMSCVCSESSLLDCFPFLRFLLGYDWEFEPQTSVCYSHALQHTNLDVFSCWFQTCFKYVILNATYITFIIWLIVAMFELGIHRKSYLWCQGELVGPALEIMLVDLQYLSENIPNKWITCTCTNFL